MILDKNQIKANVAILKCGSQMGTAFLISEDKVLTALHCIEEYSKSIDIELTFKYLEKEQTVKATPLNISISEEYKLDIIVLKLEEEILVQEYFHLSKETIPENEKWETFGYPQIELSDGIVLEGEVLYEKNKENFENFDLVLQYNEILPGVAGLSGSPLIINGQVKGIIIYDRGKRNTLGAISIKKAILIFKELDVKIYSKEEEKEIEVIENISTEKEILDYITHNNEGYIFLKGVPGSGKTTFVHNFNLKNKNIEILGKYYLKGIEDQYNIQYNSSSEILGKWFINNIHEYLYKKLLKEENRSDIELIKLIHNYLIELSKKGKKENKKFIFFIDGIDEILTLGKERVISFLKILPRELKENIFIIISGNNENLVPEYIENKIIINVSSLEMNRMVYFINNKLILENIKLNLIRKIAEKSEGNPLYLKYLISYLNAQGSITEEMVNTIPSFNGEIENYYGLYWKKIKDNQQLIKVLGIISRMRKVISKEEFLKLLPLEEQYTLESTLAIVSHLINEKDGNLKIYHTSFENFIKEKTLYLDKQIHNIIAKFCIENRNSSYSLENILYHLINSEELRKEAIKNCNQSWMDLCSFKNIDLELMFVDIENVLDITIDEGNFSDVIRILLLFQRFKFRNEKLFRTFSVEIAKALYETGKEKYILNYIIHEESLIETISCKDIKYFLHKLFKDNFIFEGKKLLKSIENKCISEFEQEKVSLEIISLDVISSFYRSPEEFFSKITYYRKEYPEIGEYLISEHLAWCIKEYGEYPDISTLKKFFNTKVTIDSINFINKIILFYVEMQECCYLTKENNGLFKAVKDLENLLQEYNVQKNSESILALIPFSKNTILLEKLIQNEKEPTFNLRSQNQVDFNFESYLEYYNYYVYKGYIGDVLEKKKIEFPREWEEFIVYVIRKVGSILGECYKARATSNTNQFLNIYKNVLEILEDLKINFMERVKWERSYFIPENIIPFIYKELAFIYINFFNDKIEDLKNYLVINYQLGLYNEGYRRALFYVSEEIVKDRKEARKAFSIVDKLEEYIDKYVLNRWERNRDFLKIIKLYGQMKAIEKAELTYKKMLETSMGPSWYKESQLTLMITGIEELKNLENKEKYISKILGNLQYASGEMTFQRYVRDDKEKMVSVIYKNLSRKKATEYLKKMIFPTYEELLNNVKEETADLVEPLKGYIQGTNEINIQDSMSYFINEMKNVDPIIKYALAEIFIQGDERYFEDYVNLQIEILTSIEDKTSIDYIELATRIKRQFVVELDEKRRELFIKILKKHKKRNLLKNILIDLKNLKIPKITLESSSFLNEESFEEENEEPIICLAQTEIEVGNIQQVKKMLSDRLIEINKEVGDVFNYSNESIKCLELLQKLCESEKEFIKYLKPICFKTYNLDWQIANELISKTGLWLSKDESIKTLEEILEHTELMLRVPKNYLERYKWIEKIDLNNEKYDIEEYIIYLTNLPRGVIYKTKAIEVLIWLGKVRPQIIIPILVHHSLKSEKEESSEIAASILHALSKKGLLNHIWYFIQLNQKIKTDILEEKHFIIKSYYYEIIKLAQNENLLNVEEYIESLETVFFSSKEKKPKIKLNLEKSSIYLNQELNYQLNQLNGIANINEEFLQKLISNLKEKISPLTVEELRKVDEILERSFHIPKDFSDIYSRTIKNEINLLISDYVTIDNYNELKKEIRNYNPYFPESEYCLEIPDIYLKIKDILNNLKKINNNFLYYKDKLILHYDEIISDKEAKKGNRIEMVAFLIKNSKKLPSPEDKLYDYFQANLDPQESKINTESSKDIYPLVHKCVFTICNNRWCTPSDVHPNFMKDYPFNYAEDIERKTWRLGTILDVEGFGMPVEEGTLLAISKELIENIKTDYRLMYKINYNLGEQILFIDVLKKTIIRVC